MITHSPGSVTWAWALASANVVVLVIAVWLLPVEHSGAWGDTRLLGSPAKRPSAALVSAVQIHSQRLVTYIQSVMTLPKLVRFPREVRSRG